MWRWMKHHHHCFNSPNPEQPLFDSGFYTVVYESICISTLLQWSWTARVVMKLTRYRMLGMVWCEQCELTLAASLAPCHTAKLFDLRASSTKREPPKRVPKHLPLRPHHNDLQAARQGGAHSAGDAEVTLLKSTGVFLSSTLWTLMARRVIHLQMPVCSSLPRRETLNHCTPWNKIPWLRGWHLLG